MHNNAEIWSGISRPDSLSDSKSRHGKFIKDYGLQDLHRIGCLLLPSPGGFRSALKPFPFPIVLII